MDKLISVFVKYALSSDRELSSLLTDYYNNACPEYKEMIEKNKFLFIKTAEQARLANSNIKKMILEE